MPRKTARGGARTGAGRRRHVDPETAEEVATALRPFVGPGDVRADVDPGRVVLDVEAGRALAWKLWRRKAPE